MTGLSNALRSKRRQVIELRLNKVDAFNLGMLIALYERAVAAYAELIHINAFHQPGVQAYKLASRSVIDLLTSSEEIIAAKVPFSGTAAEFVQLLGIAPEKEYELDGILAKLAANPGKRVLPFSVERNWDAAKGWVYSAK
jgi:glucose-6-phosphate isomerase